MRQSMGMATPPRPAGEPHAPMRYTLGALRGLRACASERGIFAVMALDHRQNLRRAMRPADPSSVTYEQLVDFKRAAVRALAPTATGTLLDPEIGAAQCIADGSLPARSGLLVAVEASGYGGPPSARESRVLDGWSVEKAKRLGASAAKLLVHYHPDAANAAHQEQLVADVAAACRAADLALFVEPLSFATVPGRTLAGEERRRVVVETARRLGAIGGDVLKAEFPYDGTVVDDGRWAEACQELDEASPIPWVLLSGGVDDATFEAQVQTACRAGASGVLAGRSVWGEATTMRPDARDRFLATTAKGRLERLVAIAERLGRPWHERPNRLVTETEPPAGWYRDY
jgi:tagatose 1,6-diphosphate aldolase